MAFLIVALNIFAAYVASPKAGKRGRALAVMGIVAVACASLLLTGEVLAPLTHVAARWREVGSCRPGELSMRAKLGSVIDRVLAANGLFRRSDDEAIRALADLATKDPSGAVRVAVVGALGGTYFEALNAPEEPPPEREKAIARRATIEEALAHAARDPVLAVRSLAAEVEAAARTGNWTGRERRAFVWHLNWRGRHDRSGRREAVYFRGRWVPIDGKELPAEGRSRW